MQEIDFTIRREKIGLFLITAALVVPTGIVASVFFWLLGAKVEVDAPKKIVVQQGQGFLEISRFLEVEGLVRRASLFRVYILSRGWAANLQPGTYTFSDTISIPEVAKRLVAGPGDIEVTIPEGFTVFDIDMRLAEQGLISQGEVVQLAQTPEIFGKYFLDAEDPETLEGFLFPDTYRFSQKMDAGSIVQKMLDNFEKKVMTIVPGEFRSGATLLDIVTLASLVEKEVSRPTDRPVVAGILWKRLESNMPLQVDATVVYAWRQVNHQWKPKEFALNATELKINSLYNTYRHRGLPPGPIGNPGLEAIRAVLKPSASEYWYYLSTSSGETIFSRNLEEHNAAKRKYLK
ncbi:MAG: endolytic transglycosylase MltG [Parcubacteria group bacterium]|nr:endolytic transglycosylase MltG [Parcubacteria group bacterium]